jgi:peptide/nickel transport system substrate-binding protein
VSKSVNWLSLLVPHDAKIIQEYLEDFKNTGFVPPFLQSLDTNPRYIQSRYDASIKWISDNDHAVISNGPFYLERYSPESRTITIKSFKDASYPFEAGHWKDYEDVKFPKITQVELPEVVNIGGTLSISVQTEDATKIHYFLTNSKGETVDSGIKEVKENTALLYFSEEQTLKLEDGANDLKIFAISESVLRPDIYTTSFLAVSDSIRELPDVTLTEFQESEIEKNYFSYISIGIGIAIVVTIMYFRRLRKKLQRSQTRIS